MAREVEEVGNTIPKRFQFIMSFIEAIFTLVNSVINSMLFTSI